MNKLLKIFLILFGIGLLAGVGTYLYVFHKPHRNIEKEQAAYVIAASDFYQEFAMDETSAYEKYGNLVIQVTGSIADITLEEDQASIVLLDEMEGISCAFDSLALVEWGEKFAQLQIGDELTLKGQCDGFDMIMGVVLSRCVLTD